MNEQRYNWQQPAPDEAEQSPIARAADTVQRVRIQASGALRGSFYAICLAVIILVEILRRFVSGELNREFSWAIVFAALVTSMTTLLTFYIILPYGKQAGMQKAAYLAAETAMQQAVEAIRAGLQIRFREWCRSKAEQEARAEMDARFEALENLYVTREDFENKWRLASRTSLLRAVWKHEITWEAMRQILLCRKPITPMPYIPEYFVAGVNARHQQKILHNSDRYEVWVMIQKPLTVMLLAVAQSAFVLAAQRVESGMEVFLAIVLSVFQICLSAFSGYLAGLKIAEHQTTVKLVKAGFMQEFLEDSVT